MVWVVVIVCSLIFLAVRAADGAFGEFVGILIAIAIVGILGIAAVIFLGSILLPIAAVLVVPAVGTWLAYKIICGAFTSNSK